MIVFLEAKSFRLEMTKVRKGKKTLQEPWWDAVFYSGLCTKHNSEEPR